MLGSMRIGFIGAGNMATALARGLREPILVSDIDRGRAEALASELGGEALESNAAVAEAADAIVLCHKPAQLEEVAAEIGERARAVVSILGGVPVSAVEAAYPDRPVYRLMPSIPVEIGQGVVCYSPGRLASQGPEAELRPLLDRLGLVVQVPDRLIGAGTAVMSCGPAFFALVVEALVDAGVRQGLGAELAGRMAVETMAGTAAVLRAGGDDTRALRTRVTSPGGFTARGLAALEAGGIRAAFDDAVAAASGADR
ncbi:MAG: pyrroline-5-carboxylate reductase [Thermoleophilaceae bacterium]|jgi:pyrroline-5-carboxylate reductase|nr:pyrroline-5-carboxylate reductase [Thermoleophilaceae bacterium]